MKMFVRLTFVLVLLTIPVGCKMKMPTLTRPRAKSAADPALVAQLKQLRFPDKAPIAGDLDIVITREGDNLRLANRTANAYENVQVWLNQQYVGQVRRVAVGTDNLVPINQFVNEFGEALPMATFLLPEQGEPLIVAHLYDPQGQVLYRLLAVEPAKKK